MLEHEWVTEPCYIDSKWWIGDDGSLLKLSEIAASIVRDSHRLSLSPSRVVDCPLDRQIRDRGVEERRLAIDAGRDDGSIEDSNRVIQPASNYELATIWVYIAVGDKII